MDERLFYFAAVLALGITAQWLAWRLRIPSILLLLGFGFAAGQFIPQQDFIDRDTLFTLVSLAVAFILLEGGLTLRFRELKQAGVSVLRLVTIGAGITWIITTVAAHYALGFGWPVSLLFGAILVVTGPTVIGPLLRSVKPAQKISTILKWEGIVIDPIGAILAVLVFEALLARHGGAHGIASVPLILGKTIVAGLGIGYLCARALELVFQRHWVPDFLQTATLLGVTAIAFAASNAIQPESGLLTVTVLGIFLANQQRAPLRHIIEFKETLRLLLISCLFIVLGGRVSPADLAAVWQDALLFFLVLVIVARPASVFLSTIGTGLTRNEKIYLSLIAPRGIVAAAVSSVFALELTHAYAQHQGDPASPILAEAERIVPVAYLVIAGTVAFYGLLAAPLARKLGLAVRHPQGIVFGGISEWAIEAARIIQDAGYRVLLIDSNYHATRRARMAGLQAINANLTSEFVTEEIDHAGLGSMLALTANDAVNSMACLAFAHVMGRSHVYQLQPASENEGSRKQGSQELTGRELFTGAPGYAQLRRAVNRDATVKSVLITETFSYESFCERYGEAAILLFVIKGGGGLQVATPSGPPPGPGDSAIALVPATPDADDDSGARADVDEGAEPTPGPAPAMS